MNYITTITIDDDTKEELLKIAAHLQIKRREKINYDKTIKFLIENFQNKKDEAKFRKACEKIENVDINEVLNDLYLGRRKDDISF
ncbi:MAG: hypothetical protein ACTSQJ_01185 [Promethearchaeota archaeon]